MTTVNPRADLKFTRDATGIASIRIEAPVKGEGLRVSTVDRESDAELFAFFLIYSATQGAGDAIASLSTPERARLSEMGFLIGDHQVAAPVLFDCDIMSPPAELLPRHAQPVARPAAAAPADLIVDPTVRPIGPGGPPPEMRGRYRLANPFRTDLTWFSVDVGPSAPAFYSCEPELGRQLNAVVAGERAPGTLPAATRARLREAGILTTAADVARRQAARSAAIAAAHRQLTDGRHVVLSDVVPPVQLAAIRRYYRQMIDEGFVRYGDADWPHRYFASRDPLTYFFQQQLTDVVSAVAGERVKPSFSFFTSYRPGADLPAHKDREQCYFAMSVLLDHGQSDDVSAWPIYVQPPGVPEAIPIHAALGDGLLYFGEEVLHYRYPLSAGYSTLWFLFWVPEHFSASLD